MSGELATGKKVCFCNHQVLGKTRQGTNLACVYNVTDTEV